MKQGWRDQCWVGSIVLGALCSAAACSASDAPTDDGAARAGDASGSGGAAGNAGSGGDPNASGRDAGASAGDASGAAGVGEEPSPSPPGADAAVRPIDAASDTRAAMESGAAPAGVFVAVGYGGRTTRSIDDGRSWIDDTSLVAKGGDDNDLLRTVVWGKGQFVALGWRVLTSTDGHAWQVQGGVMGQWIGAAIFAKSTYVAVGGYGLRSTSNDGVTWKAHTIDEVASHEHGALAYGEVQGGRFVSANDDGRRSYATDGADWKYGSGATVPSTLLAFGQGVFVGIGDNQVVFSRDGGSTWTAGAKLAGSVQGLVFADGHFTALADRHVFTSADGAAWQDHPVDSATGGPLAYGHGTYVSVRETSFRRSSDGVIWSAPIAAGGANNYEWITFGAP